MLQFGKDLPFWCKWFGFGAQFFFFDETIIKPLKILLNSLLLSCREIYQRSNVERVWLTKYKIEFVGICENFNSLWAKVKSFRPFWFHKMWSLALDVLISKPGFFFIKKNKKCIWYMGEVLLMNIYVLPMFLQMELVVSDNWIQLNIR